MNKDTRNIFILTAVVIGLLAPFVNKPFNVDDPFYLKAAEQIVRDPLHPYSYSINWSGEKRDVWQRMEATFPPLVSAYSALIIKTFGEKERVLHVFFMIFPVLAAVSFYYISKKYLQHPLFASLIFAACPSFLVSATSIMLDVPLCAFMLGALALFIYGADNDNNTLMTLGSLSAACAALTKYSGIFVIAVIIYFLYTIKKIKYSVFMLIPLFFFGLWCAHNLIVYNGVHFLLASKHIGKGFSLHKITAFGTFFGGCLIFPVFMLFAAPLKDARALALLTVVLFGFGYIVLGGILTSFLFSVFCASTIYFLYRTAAEKNNLNGFLLVWFFAGILTVLVPERSISARYLLVNVPPAVLIFAKIIETLPQNFGKPFRYASLAGVAAFGISLGISDYVWAKSYVEMSKYVVEKKYNSGYFTGHFGLQYYLEKAGMQALEVNKPLEGGGYLIAAKIPDPQKPSTEIVEKLRLIEKKPFESGFPLRLMNPALRAGFYSSYWGILPFNFSLKPLDEAAVYEIVQGKDK